MATTPSPRHYPSPPNDKENASSSRHHRVVFKSPYHPKTPLQSHDDNQQHTPPGSSKLLRKHFSQLAVTPQRTNLQSGAVRIEPKRPHLQSGARRLTATTTPASSKRNKPRRIGYDGTHQTPSRQLLKSTACSRNHRIQQQDHNVVVDESFTSLPSPPVHKEGAVVVRDECCDPVALTLLNDGTEDLQHLLEQDCRSPQKSVPKVSSRLLDVMNHDEVATLVRPVAKKVARP